MGFLMLYFCFWIAYAVWILDLAFGLPWGLSRQSAVPALFGVALVLFFTGQAVSRWLEKRAPLDEGYQRCPHCRAVVLKLAAECPACKKPL